MTENNRNVSSNSFGGQKYKSKVLAGSVPSGCPEGESGPWLSPGLWRLPATLGVLWLVIASLNFCPCLHVMFFLVSMSKFPFSSKNTSQWTRAHPNPVWPHFDSLLVQRTCFFSNKVTFWDFRWLWILGVTIQLSILLPLSFHFSLPPP